MSHIEGGGRGPRTVGGPRSRTSASASLHGVCFSIIIFYFIVWAQLLWHGAGDPGAYSLINRPPLDRHLTPYPSHLPLCYLHLTTKYNKSSLVKEKSCAEGRHKKQKQKTYGTNGNLTKQEDKTRKTQEKYHKIQHKPTKKIPNKHNNQKNIFQVEKTGTEDNKIDKKTRHGTHTQAKPPQILNNTAPQTPARAK